MAGHVRAAAWLRIVWSGLGLIMLLSVLLLFQGTMRPLIRDVTRATVQDQTPRGGSSDALPAVNLDELVDLSMRSVSVVLVVLALLELPGLAVGWGLLRYRPWARPLNIAYSIFDLFSIPIGTVIGVYSLWVMFRPETAALFRNPPGQGPALL